MEFIIKNGLSVCHKGWVIIESVEHYVNNCFVICNNSLNGKSWNTTEKKTVCHTCAKFAYKLPEQLKLF